MVDENKLQSISIQTNESVTQNTNYLKQTSYEEKKIFFNTCFDKNHLKTVIAWFLDQYGEKVTVDLVETLKQVGFHQATIAGVSLGVDDLQIPPQKKTLLSQASVKMNDVTNSIQAGNVTSVEKSQRLIDTWNQTSETLRQTAIQNFRTTNPVNPVYMMAFSGARGNISQVRQLVAMRGLMADPQGAILEFPIQSNFREGLTITEYLISCYGARKGLVDTALRTATSGYLTRRLVDAVQHVVVNISDCQTKKGIILKEKNLEQRLLGRVLFQDLCLNEQTIVKKNTLISQPLAKQIASKYKSIVVRSPLTCQTEKSVCQLCYGVDLSQGKLVSLGEAVGIIAAQSIGEPGTQLTMRTFHTGGVGVFSDQAMKSFSAPFEGKVEFLEPLTGLFVRTPHGNIVYLVKQKIINENKPILRLVGSHSGQKSSIFQIMHSDVPSGSLLWVKQGEIVKTGQLLLQASRLQTTTQEMPESSHPVRSNLSGEIFFHSMSIRVVEEEKRLLSKLKKKKQQLSLSSHINQKEISPKIPTLIELGNFWIFSTFVQKEKNFCNSFFVPGDLVSRETPIQEYNIHVLKSGQLKKLNSSLIFGRNWFDFLVSKIHYSGLFYFLQSFSTFPKNEFLGANSPTLVAYTSNSNYTGFTWYPFSNDVANENSGYFSLLQSQNFFSGSKTSEVSDNFKITNQETIKFLNLSYTWAPHQIFTLKPLAHSFFEKLSFGIFILANQNLSKNGIFQYVSISNLNWNLKTRFETFILKNPNQNSVTNSPGNIKFTVGTFLEKGLTFSQKLFFKNSSLKMIQKNKIWFYLPETKIDAEIPSLLPGILLEPGKKFENITFSNSYTATNLINGANLLFLKSKTTKNYKFYTIDNFLNPKSTFFDEKSTNSKETGTLFPSENAFPQNWEKTFCFYKQTVENIFRSEKEFRTVQFTLKLKLISSYFLIFQKNNDTFISNSTFFKQKFISLSQNVSNSIITSPTFTKQSKTEFKKQEYLKPSFKLVSPKNSSWSAVPNFLKIEIKLKRPKSFLKKEEFKKCLVLKNQPIVVPKFSLFFYQAVKFKNIKDFRFETFSQGWVFPNSKITTAFLTSQKLAEFRFAQSKQKETGLSLLRNQDKTSIILPPEKIRIKTIDVGTKLRMGQEIFPGFATPASGQITKLTLKTLTLRRGVPLLASIRGLVHISHKDLVQKNDLLITLRSRRLQTEDIVQGIPKIEQLFEARETQGGEIIQNNMHTVLQNFFIRAKKVRPVEEAVQLSLSYIQKFLVENILEAYSNQGVNIAEKHVEVVVRQMTARVRITTGGDTGFLPGELVQLKWIEKLNSKLKELGRREAQYEPVILGITKSVLQSESFLLAASFQQVSKVLVKSALSKKTDFLRGLHENILVGQPIPAGTGIIGISQTDETFDESFENLEFSNSGNMQFRLDL